MSIKQPGMTNAEYLRVLRQRAVAAGKCYMCRCRPAQPLTRYCADCRERVDANQKSLIRRRMCITCCCNLPRQWVSQECPGCAQVAADRRVERKAEWAAAGLCSNCGKFPHAPGYRRCLACNEAGRLRQLAWNRDHGMQPVPRCSICTRLGMPGVNHNRMTHARHMALEAQWRTA